MANSTAAAGSSPFQSFRDQFDEENGLPFLRSAEAARPFHGRSATICRWFDPPIRRLTLGRTFHIPGRGFRSGASSSCSA